MIDRTVLGVSAQGVPGAPVGPVRSRGPASVELANIWTPERWGCASPVSRRKSIHFRGGDGRELGDRQVGNGQYSQQGYDQGYNDGKYRSVDEFIEHRFCLTK